MIKERATTMQPLPTIDQLIFKGTHNSYSCAPIPASAMHDPPNVQIDGYGVWALELDVSQISVNGNEVVVIGHDSEGDSTCYGDDYPLWPRDYYLASWLVSIRNTMSLRYRPVFIYFDIKWQGEGTDPWGDGTYRDKLNAAIATVNNVFEHNCIVLEDILRNHQPWPTAIELAGKAIIYFPLPEFHPGYFQGSPLGTLTGADLDQFRTGEEIEQAIANGSRVLRLDLYQPAWTFEYGVPPNPLVVDAGTQPPQFIEEQGTFSFPYRTVSKAITRAEGTTSNGVRDERRSGLGWTVLIRPGNYPEPVTIDIPLTLEKDDRFAGTVVIGQ
jgi:hypothetical protein